MSLARQVRDGTIDAGSSRGHNASRRVLKFASALLRFQRISELCEAAFLELGRVQEIRDNEIAVGRHVRQGRL